MKRKSTSSHRPVSPGKSSNIIPLPSPEMAAAASMRRMLDRHSTDPDPDPEVIAKALQAQGEAVAGGDATLIRRALAAQVTTLERLFHHFMQLAAEEKPGSDAHDRIFRLALRAQIQSARTGTMLARLCHRLPAVTPKEAAETMEPMAKTMLGESTVLPDIFMSPQRVKQLANHTDPEINFLTKRPRVRFMPGSAAHDLYEHATSSECFAKALEDLLNSKVPWPRNTSAAEYARNQVALHQADAEAA